MTTAIYGNVRSVKPYASSGNCVIEVEIPVESFKGASQFFDEKVLVTLADLGDRPFGMVESEYPGGEDQRAMDEVEQRTEQPAEEAEPPRKSGKFPGGLCGLAVRWCQDVHFQGWLLSQFTSEWERHENLEDQEEIAKAIVCGLCQIDSRKELNEDEFAASEFDRIIRIPYAQVRKDDELPE